MQRPVSRRSFLPILCGSLLLLPIVGDEIGANARGVRFENTTAGISLVRPEGWHTISLQEIEKNRQKVRMPDEKLQELVQKNATAPLFAFSKYPEPHPDLNPSIQVVLRPIGPLEGMSAVRIMELAMQPLQQMFTDFAYIEEIQGAEVGGLEAARMRASYTIATAEGEMYRTMSRMWMVPRGAFLFIIGMSGPDSGPDVSDEVFAAVLDSIKISP